MDSKQRKSRILLAAAAVTLLNLCFVVFWPSPLTSEEKQLVGEWSLDSSLVWHLSSNRRYSACDGQIVGVWQLDQGKLTLKTWSEWYRPNFLSISSIKWSLHEYRRSLRNTRTVTLDIELSGDGSQMTVVKPVDAQHPDGKQMWSRVAAR